MIGVYRWVLPKCCYYYYCLNVAIIILVSGYIAKMLLLLFSYLCLHWVRCIHDPFIIVFYNRCALQNYTHSFLTDKSQAIMQQWFIHGRCNLLRWNSSHTLHSCQCNLRYFMLHINDGIHVYILNTFTFD